MTIRSRLSLQTRITILVCLVIMISLAITGVLIGMKEAQNTKNNLSDKAMDVAHMVAETPLVINSLDGNGNPAAVEPFTLKIQKATQVRYIVVMNMHHIRLSHPNKRLIGKPFVGGDEYRALRGETYISSATGTLGNSMRAFVPVRTAAGTQVGVVSVGIMTDKVDVMVARSERIIYLGVGIGLAAGIIGALILARQVKRTLFGLEPHAIARLWEERNAMLEVVREGIVAVDAEGRIVLLNAAAHDLFHKIPSFGDPIGKDISTILPGSRLGQILEQRTAEYDQELTVNGRTFIVNRIPVTVNDEVVGAIATFRDKSELQHVIEQLTGTRRYADALRVQTHEFMNKLHVILGVVHLKRYDELTKYIQEWTRGYQLEVGAVSKLTNDPVLAGFLLSKLSDAREHDVELRIVQPATEHSIVPEVPPLRDDLITILGNLLDNAIEAAEAHADRRIILRLTHHSGELTVVVSDSGSGIANEVRESMFDKGVSSKGNNRGYGLFLVRQRVNALGGKLTYASDSNGTVFTVNIPYELPGGDPHDSSIGG